MLNKKVKVYTLDHCPYCDRAKSLLAENAIPYDEIRVGYDDDQTRNHLMAISGMKTFPQIFYGDDLIGGYTELKALDEEIGLKNHI